MKDTDVAVKETVNGRRASSRDRMIGDEDLLTSWHETGAGSLCGPGYQTVRRGSGSAYPRPLA
jgi:hypothetical protein